MILGPLLFFFVAVFVGAVLPQALHESYKRWLAGLLTSGYVWAWMRFFPAALTLWGARPEGLELSSRDRAEPAPARSRAGQSLALLAAAGFLVLSWWEWSVLVGHIRTLNLASGRERRYGGNEMMLIRFSPAPRWLTYDPLETVIRAAAAVAAAGLLGWLMWSVPAFWRNRRQKPAQLGVVASAIIVLSCVIWMIVS